MERNSCETLVTNVQYKNKNLATFDIKVLNFILTPLTCATLLNEIIKCLVYEKSLIPYPYSWLKNVVNIRKKQSVEIVNTGSVILEKQNRVASAAFDAIENIANCIKKLFKSEVEVREVMVLLGATPLSPSEVYRFSIPKLARGHSERNHFDSIPKVQQKVLRSLFLSQEWMTKMQQRVPLTNLFVFVRRADGEARVHRRTLEGFLPASSFFVPKNAQSLTVNLLYNNDSGLSCCSVYEENMLEDIAAGCSAWKGAEGTEEDMCELRDEWLQVCSVLKGFK